MLKIFGSDGAATGVQLAATNGSGVQTVNNLGSMNGRDLFVLADSSGDRLFIADGFGAHLVSTTPINGITSVSVLGVGSPPGGLPSQLYSTLSGGVFKVFATNGYAAPLQLAATNGAGVQAVNNLGSINGSDLFVVADSSGYRLFGSGGTAATTYLLSTTPINGTTSVSLMASDGSVGYYSTLSGGVTRVFSTNGASTGVQLAATNGAGSAYNLGSINYYDLFVVADGGGYRLYSSTLGNLAGTHLLSTTLIRGTTSLSLMANEYTVGAGAHLLYSTLQFGVSGVFSTDGASAVQLASTNGPGSVNNLGSINQHDLFLVADSNGDRLYGSDGTVATTHLLSATPISGTTSVSLMATVTGLGLTTRQLYSTLSGGVIKVLSTDGAAAGVWLASTNGSGVQTLNNLGSINGSDLFVLTDSSGYRLFIADVYGAHLVSTTPINGITSVSLLGVGTPLSGPQHQLYSTLSGGVLKVFATNGALAGVQLAATNGAGVQSVKNLGSVNGYDLFVLADSSGYRLFSSQGTGTTYMLSTTPLTATAPSLMATVDRAAFYSIVSGGVTKVFATDGATTAIQVAASNVSGAVNNLGSINGYDLFVLVDGSGYRLFGSLGNLATTHLLSTTTISGTTSVSLMGIGTPPGAAPRELYSTLSGGVSKVFSTDGVTAFQLAATNGTGSVKDLGSINGYDLFVVADSSGDRLYGSSGTAATTYLLSTTPINGATSVSLLASVASRGQFLTGPTTGVASLAQAMATFGASDQGVSQPSSVVTQPSSSGLVSLPHP